MTLMFLLELKHTPASFCLFVLRLLLVGWKMLLCLFKHALSFILTRIEFCMDMRGANPFTCLKTTIGEVLIKKLFLKISQYSQESTCIGAFFK